MRLIDADALIQEIREDNEGYYFNSSAEREVNFAKVDYAINRISEAPTIEERPTGEWIDTGSKEEYWDEEYQCSMCGEKDHWHKFCPNCGADMRKEEEK